MKKYFILLIMIILSSFSFAQTIIVYTGEPAMLVAKGAKHGTIQWQISPDAVSWSDLAGVIGDSVLFFPDTLAMYYRAVIRSGSCLEIVSDIRHMKCFECGDTIIDYRDGRPYRTVQIGTQCWMGKNMAVGTNLHGGQTMMNNNVIERYCFDNDTNNCNTFGALYQWDEAMQYSSVEGAQGICPKGWHIPTDQEILTLELYLGMDASVSTMINFWRGSNQGWQLSPQGTSGFNANYTGLRYDYGVFYNQGNFEFIYTSTTNASNSMLAWRRCLSTSDSTIGRFNNTMKTTGASVRCLKD